MLPFASIMLMTRYDMKWWLKMIIISLPHSDMSEEEFMADKQANMTFKTFFDKPTSPLRVRHVGTVIRRNQHCPTQLFLMKNAKNRTKTVIAASISRSKAEVSTFLVKLRQRNRSRHRRGNGCQAALSTSQWASEQVRLCLQILKLNCDAEQVCVSVFCVYVWD